MVAAPKCAAATRMLPVPAKGSSTSVPGRAQRLVGHAQRQLSVHRSRAQGGNPAPPRPYLAFTRAALSETATLAPEERRAGAGPGGQPVGGGVGVGRWPGGGT